MNKNVIKELSKVLGIEETVLVSKLEAEGDQQLDIKGTLYTEEALNKRIQNDPNYMSDANKTTLIESTREAALEVWTKGKKRELGLEFTGKDPNDLVKALQDAKLGDGDEELKKAQARIDELTNEKKTILDSKTALEEELNGKLTSLQSEKDSIVLDYRLTSLVPKETAIPSDKIIKLFKMDHTLDTDADGKEFVRNANNEVVKDKTTFEYITVDKVFEDYATQYIQKPTGRGQGNNFGNGQGKADDLEEFNKNWEASGKNMKGLEYQNALAEFHAEQQN